MQNNVIPQNIYGLELSRVTFFFFITSRALLISQFSIGVLLIFILRSWCFFFPLIFTSGIHQVYCYITRCQQQMKSIFLMPSSIYASILMLWEKSTLKFPFSPVLLTLQRANIKLDSQYTTSQTDVFVRVKSFRYTLENKQTSLSTDKSNSMVKRAFQAARLI